MRHITDFNISNSDLEHIINEWIHNDVHKDVLKRRYINGLTFEKIAEEMDLSTASVKKIIYKSEPIITKYSHKIIIK